MQIDCRNLDCPEPIIRTKDSIENLNIGDDLEILLNSEASFTNVKKFLSTNKFEFSVSSKGGDHTLNLKKTHELIDQNVQNYNCDIKFKDKVLFLKEDKVGSDPIGRGLLAKFLGSIHSLEQSKRPAYIVCVNEAVLMTTSRSHPSYAALKELEGLGVKILSCGSCLEAMGLVDRLGVGSISNAFEIMNILLENETVSL